jgi:hypothetical protein
MINLGICVDLNNYNLIVTSIFLALFYKIKYRYLFVHIIRQGMYVITSFFNLSLGQDNYLPPQKHDVHIMRPVASPAPHKSSPHNLPSFSALSVLDTK